MTTETQTKPEYDREKLVRFIAADNYLKFKYGRMVGRNPGAIEDAILKSLFLTEVLDDPAMAHAYAVSR